LSSRDEDLVRDVTRELLTELLPGMLENALTPSANGHGRHATRSAPSVPGDERPVPQVPAPPIARIHRPSGWQAPDPGGAESSEIAPEGVDVVRVELRTDSDLEAFVSSLARRLANEQEREAILSGAVQFRLADSPADCAGAATVIRVEKGAVTERIVREAARAKARLVLSQRAVVTPMARDRARSLGVEIERETQC
jgi:regulator of protease activity HflC (stomatin/prohibitin superfamily)